MSPFSRYLVIPQYFYFKYRDMVFINTAQPYSSYLAAATSTMLLNAAAVVIIAALFILTALPI